MERVLAFGEMMMRLSPTGHARLEQAQDFQAYYGGAEANVAVSLAIQGMPSAYVSVIPENRIGDNAVRALSTWGVDVSRVIREGDRLGIYFFERGASVRPNSVVYDRKYSAFSLTPASRFDWDAILEGVSHFYFSGVTPAISSELAAACEEALAACRRKGIVTIVDLNYRGKMWSPEKAQETMKKILPLVDIVIANDEDAPASLGIAYGTGSLAHGIEERACYERIAHDICVTYGCRMVASVIRDIQSVESSQWMGMLYTAETDTAVYSPIHEMHVLEGIAAGDAFAAGLIYALGQDWSDEETINYAIAASVLKLTVQGDANLVTSKEIAALAQSAAGSTRVER